MVVFSSRDSVKIFFRSRDNNVFRCSDCDNIIIKLANSKVIIRFDNYMVTNKFNKMNRNITGMLQIFINAKVICI